MQTTKKKPSLIFILVGAVLAGYLGYLINGAWTEGIAFNEFMDRFNEVCAVPFANYYNSNTVKAVAIALGIYAMAIVMYYTSQRNYMPGKEFGTARFENPKQVNKILADKDENFNRILSQNVKMSLDFRRLKLNGNILICGGSGADVYKRQGYRRIENPVKQPLVHQVSQKQAEERKPFVLPEPAGDNSYLISYLNQERGISRTVIDLFLKDGLIYESRHYHNVVFKGNDKNGVTRFASMRGVFDKQGKPFKCDVTGNDKNYGFNVVNENSTELVVFEAAIDLMSYVDIFTDYESNKLALGMLADAPLETFLREHPQITSIRFCLDGDEPGRKAAAELMRKYYELGYEVEDCPPPAGYKDYNEWLVAAKLNLNRMNKRADEPVRA